MVRHYLLLLLLLFSAPLHAGLSFDEIIDDEMAGDRTLSEEERRETEAQMARQAAEAEARRRAEAEALQRAEEAELARLAARPWPVRLTEQRCASCHDEGYYTSERMTRIGWEVTVWRMRLFNGVSLESGEHAVIVAHLSEAYAASGGRRLLEWGLLLALPLVFAVLGLWYRSRRRR